MLYGKYFLKNFPKREVAGYEQVKARNGGVLNHLPQQKYTSKKSSPHLIIKIFNPPLPPSPEILKLPSPSPKTLYLSSTGNEKPENVNPII